MRTQKNIPEQLKLSEFADKSLLILDDDDENDDNGDEEEEVAAKDLKVGDVIRVRPGENVAAGGRSVGGGRAGRDASAA